MREERNKAESVPARSEERRPRRSRSREAFRQRQKELAESRGQEKRAQENGGQEKRVQENKLQENRVQDTPGTGEDRTHGGQPENDGQGTFNTQGKGPFDKFRFWPSLFWLESMHTKPWVTGIHISPIQLLMGWTYQGKP